MAYVDWLIRTKIIGTCSCDYGCPCEFNAPPTRLPCEGVMAMEITEGHFGDVRLDGLRTAGVYRWPGPVHEGGGTWWSIIDKRASKPQVDALFTIMAGKEQGPPPGSPSMPLRSPTNRNRCSRTSISNGCRAQKLHPYRARLAKAEFNQAALPLEHLRSDSRLALAGYWPA